MKKVLVSDFDGTFYRSEEELNRNIHLIKEFRKDGNIFVIATGRSYEDFMSIIKDIDLEYDYLIINNGATILDSFHHILKKTTFPKELPKKIYQTLDLDDMRDKQFYFCCSILKSRVTIDTSDITKIAVYYKDYINIFLLREQLNMCFGSDISVTVRVDRPALEIVSKGVNKASAIHDLLELKELSKYPIFVIGDSDNDIEMITSYQGVCVESALETVKQISSKVFYSVESYIKYLDDIE